MFFFYSPLLSLLSLLSQLCLLSLQCLLSLFLLPFISQLFQITLASLTSLILLLTLQPLSYQSYLSHLSLYHWYLTHLSHITLATLSQISNPILSNIAQPQKYIIVSIFYYPPFNVNNDLYLYTWSITFANKFYSILFYSNIQFGFVMVEVPWYVPSNTNITSRSKGIET